MIAKLPESMGNVIGFAFNGILTDEEYATTLLPELERALENYPNVRILFRIVDFHGWKPHGAWEALRSWPGIGKVDRIALVGGERWREWMNRLPGLFVGFTGIDVRYFPDDHLQDAWGWLKWS
jgi:hypothetical protein